MSEPELDYFDEAPFILALDASPEDDISRLAYADWLEERGDARADYLRAIAAFRQIVRERDAGPEDWLPVHRHWKGRLDAWQQDVGGWFDVAVTRFWSLDRVGYILGRERARSLAASCRSSGWELVHHRLALYRAAQACRSLASAGCTATLRASRLAYPYDYTRLAPCVSNYPAGELRTTSLPHGLLTTWTDDGGPPPAYPPSTNQQRPPAIFTGEHGSSVLADVAGLDLLARTSGYVPGKRNLSAILPPGWYLLDRPARPQRAAGGIDFYCQDVGRGWTLRCEYRATGCRVSAVGRSPKEPS